MSNLTKTYRAKKTDISHLSIDRYTPHLSFSSNFDGRSSRFKLSIAPEEYLEVAKKAARSLQTISGIEYKVMAKHPKSNVWREV